ncbi:MAG: glycosyltransferase family 9 protein [Candidatus Omnitrophica bacterium]|nr:glycosyltransferase family 9 protein [Candidatus Omnitrophota bacterium]
MNIRLVRIIDYYFGIPICFFLTLINKIFPRKPLNPHQDKVRSVLFIELSEMGSTILAYSAINEVRNKYPDAQLFFLIFNRNKESVELLKIIKNENILTLRDKNFFLFLVDNIKLIFKFARLKIDIAYDLELFSRYSVILTYLSGARTRVGFHRYTAEGLYRGNLLTHNVYYNTHVHMVHNFLALIQASFEDPKNVPMLKRAKAGGALIRLPEFQFDENLLSKYENLIFNKSKKTLIINPNVGSTLPIRGWGTENFAKVVHQVISLLDLNVIIVGLSEAAKDAQYILNQVGHRPNIVDLTGKTKNIYELIHVIQSGDIFLTNDSGPAHFASLTKSHILVLFGPETPDLYGPISSKSIPLYSHYLCSPCLTARNHRNTICRDNQCLQAITPERVVGEIKQLV